MKNTNENFEFYFEELEKILRKLESQNISLDESIKLFEDGAKLAKKCEYILDKANLKIKEINSEFSNISEIHKNEF
ncbi:MAG: exodeoxyribonuclease VII small subunit [Chloroflexi bacterium]|nr:exodeoxyribonuclease VII small subunit [Chloroflexota bacterium]|tara:strand:- start:966 stop:1193 length:228 start_codon:yes stop_codon:yes gene_type:complete